MTAAEVLAAQARRRPYRVAELAELWDVDTSTVYRMIDSGRLRAERHGARGGALRVPVDAVAEYVRQAATRASAPGLAGGAEAGSTAGVAAAGQAGAGGSAGPGREQGHGGG